jgi:hypothetical protein
MGATTSHVVIKYYDDKTGAVKLLHQTIDTLAANPLSTFEKNICEEGQTILYAACHQEGPWGIHRCGLCEGALVEASKHKKPSSNELVDDAKPVDCDE